MSGFTLGSPLSGGLVYRGPMYVPGAAPANVPGAGTAGSTSAGRTPTIATVGYGITAGPPSGGPRTAHWGVVGGGLAASALLLYMWYSLPR
jgi:hypothetical protein